MTRLSAEISSLYRVFDISMGDICGPAHPESLEISALKSQPLSMNSMVNFPFAGKVGKYVTSRHIKERLRKSLRLTLGLVVVPDSTDSFKVSGRGELYPFYSYREYAP